MKNIAIFLLLLSVLSGCVEQNSRKVVFSLIVASTEGDIDTFYELIAKDANINETDERGFTPLLYAIMNNHSKIAKELILKGADVNTANKFDCTPLLAAAMQGDEILELLLIHGADINKNAPLVLASAEGNYYAVNALIAHGADLDKRNREDGTPLMVALFNDHEKIAKLLIEKGADVNKSCKDGSGDPCSPLLTATIHGMYDIVNLLIKRGAKIDAVDKRGATSLFFAAGTGHTDIAKLLINYGVDVNKSEDDGISPLHSAVYNGHLEVAKLLLEKGANVNAKTKEGVTPLMIAEQQNKMEIINLLKKYQNKK